MIFQSETTLSRKTKQPVWLLRCDDCNAEAPGCGNEPGEAADAARKAGYTTTEATASNPARWLCPACKKA